MTLEPDKIYLFLENNWFVVASTLPLLSDAASEDPALKLTLARSEAPTIFTGILKFKKKGYYIEEEFSLESPAPDALCFSLHRRGRLFPRPDSVKIHLEKDAEVALWEEEVGFPRRTLWHLLSLTPHPEASLIREFLTKHREKGFRAPIESLRPCTQRCERLNLSFLGS